jgi:hypothetical protein
MPQRGYGAKPWVGRSHADGVTRPTQGEGDPYPPVGNAEGVADRERRNAFSVAPEQGGHADPG